MIETPHKYILNRELSKMVAGSHLEGSLSLIKELVNYGTNLIPRCFASSGREVKDLVILGSLLKSFVTMVDGAEILLSEGAQQASSLQIRALFELQLYIAWILKDDTEQRARLYYVWNLRKRRYWNNTSVPNTAENAKFAPHFAKQPSSRMRSLPSEMKKAIEKELTDIETLLKSPEYERLNAEFDRLKGKRLRDVPWYQPFGGASSIKELADHLGYADQYDISYDQLSGVAHSTAFFKQVVAKDECVTFEPIRDLAGVESHFLATGTYCLQTYRMVLEYYRPAELEAFNRKYRDEWRNRFRGVKSVKNTNPILVHI